MITYHRNFMITSNVCHFTLHCNINPPPPHLDFSERVEAVELIEQLHQRSLNLTIGRSALREATTACNHVRVTLNLQDRIAV